MIPLEAKDCCHFFSDPQPHWTNQNSDTGSAELSSLVHATDKILIGSRSVSNTDKLTVIINSVPSQGEATAIYAPNPTPVIAVAAIPEAGPCGFDWEDVS